MIKKRVLSELKIKKETRSEEYIYSTGKLSYGKKMEW